jgi:hypothetical protein
MIKKLLVFFTLILLLFQCKKPKNPSFPDLRSGSALPIHALVVLSSGESRILHSDLTEEKAAIGAFFRNGDKIFTGSRARVDIQIEGTAILRIGPESKIEFKRVLGSVPGGFRETVIEVEEGKLYAKVEKATRQDRFIFYTNGVQGEVRGTEFIIASPPAKSVIKVLEGKISLRPRIRPIEHFHQTKETPPNTLIELENRSVSREIQMDSPSELWASSISPVLEKVSISEEEARIGLKLLENVKWVPQNLELTKTEEQEIKTLVMEDAEITRQMIEINEELSSGKVDDNRALELEALRSSLENKITKKQEVEKVKFNESIVVLPKKFKTKKEIVRYYERMEKIILSRNRVEVGAIISQEGDIIIIHTENGIRRIPNEDVVEVIYEYQKKIRY